jgi:putative glycosyltransferase (TIGR04372 family)
MMVSERLLRFVRLAVAVVPATGIVLASRLLRPFFTVRFGSLKADRIGHFVLETELMLHEQDVGIRPRPRRCIDIYYAPRPVSNTQIEMMWSRVIRMWPRWLMVAVYRINRLVPGSDRHIVPTASSSCLDVHNLLDRTAPKLFFTPDEIVRGNQLLRDLGIGADEEFVCVIVRDAAYYKQALPNQDLSYHDFRNCDIDTYVPGLEALADRGVVVLRMGAIVEKPMRSNHPKLIDYASSPLRSAFGDVFLASRCKFTISDGLGFYALPAAFRRPNAYVNYSPFHMFYSSRSVDLGIAKVFVDAQSQRLIPLRDLVGRDIARLTRTELIAASGMAICDNSPEEIRELLLEMNDRLDGVWRDEIGDDTRQQAFWSKFAAVIGPEGRAIHGELRSRYGAHYLRTHLEWFAE